MAVNSRGDRSPPRQPAADKRSRHQSIYFPSKISFTLPVRVMPVGVPDDLDCAGFQIDQGEILCAAEMRADRLLTLSISASRSSG